MSRIEPNYSQIQELLDSPKDVVILSHRNPDGDAVGSSLGLRFFLEKFGHSVKVILPSEYPANFEWMPGAADIVIYDIEKDRALELLGQANWVFCLDFNGLDRIDKLGEQLHRMEVPKVMIDHHMDPEPIASEMLSDPQASSTCELIVDFAQGLHQSKMIDPDVAECLYTGLITDTGRFRHSVTPKVFQTAALLLERGIRDQMINDYIFNNYSEKQLRLLGYSLYHRLEVLEDYQTAIISLSKSDYKNFSISRGDTEGIVNYMLTMPHVKLAAFITEQPTIVKYSLRSKGDISVQDMARNHFNGGGHFNAAGGSTRKPLRKAIDDFKKILPNYIPSNLKTESL